MGWRLHELEPRLRERIHEAQTPALPERALPERESDLHDQIAEYCRERGWYFVHSRMDRKTTTAKGVFDFCIAMPKGRVAWIELKRKGGKASMEQLATQVHLRHLGHIAEIVDNAESAYKLLQ